MKSTDDLRKVLADALLHQKDMKIVISVQDAIEIGKQLDNADAHNLSQHARALMLRAIGHELIRKKAEIVELENHLVQAVEIIKELEKLVKK
jgi:hypothetical protein